MDNKLLILIAGLTLANCSFNFDVTSQRTALENQVMGSYLELEDDLILASSVRGGKQAKAAIPESKRRALDALLNQKFNRDDVDELKDKEIIGEAVNGGIVVLPTGIGHQEGVKASDIKLARQLVDEENHDRDEILRRVIAANANLSEKDLPKLRETDAKLQREATRSGQWYQDVSGKWVRKPGVESLK